MAIIPIDIIHPFSIDLISINGTGISVATNYEFEDSVNYDFEDGTNYDFE